VAVTFATDPDFIVAGVPRITSVGTTAQHAPSITRYD
jgi:hypothetical protein